MDDIKYDVTIVGAGLIGSAAAKHLQKMHLDWRILLIGPNEPDVSTSLNCK